MALQHFSFKTIMTGDLLVWGCLFNWRKNPFGLLKWNAVVGKKHDENGIRFMSISAKERMKALIVMRQKETWFLRSVSNLRENNPEQVRRGMSSFDLAIYWSEGLKRISTWKKGQRDAISFPFNFRYQMLQKLCHSCIYLIFLRSSDYYL